MQRAAVRLIPQGTAEITLEEFVSYPLQGRLDIVQELSSLKLFALGRGDNGRQRRLLPGLGRDREARGMGLGVLLLLGIEGFHLRPVPRLEHLNARAKLFVELPPEPLVLGLVHVQEGSARRERTQAPRPSYPTTLLPISATSSSRFVVPVLLRIMMVTSSSRKWYSWLCAPMICPGLFTTRCGLPLIFVSYDQTP